MMTTDAVGGVWTFSTTLARSLAAFGFEILLVTLGPRPNEAQKAMLRGTQRLSLVETDLQLEWQDPAGADLCHADAVLCGLADRFGPDLVHLNSFREAIFDWNVPTVVVAHSCVNSWAEACGETDAFTGDDWKAYSQSIRAGLQKSNAWVAPTRAFRGQLASQHGLPETGEVIWNGAETRSRSPAAKQPFVLSAGRLWDKAKNLSAVARAAPAIEWPIRIAGQFARNSTLATPITSNCELLGEISHAALLGQMEKASIFISPALYEPFGLSVLEAASAGCALLLSDIPTFRELWNGAAVFFNPHDPDEIRRCLRLLCDDEMQRMRLQHAAAKRSLEYPLSKTARAYRSVYGSLLTVVANSPSADPQRGEMMG
ncbi:MAG TPA: glycosyltransferase family 4 protein [Bradyrhizobium sp.]|nr:glycosyltransferase family 4 protein [Bradyrhizobium sp.]